MAKSASAKIIRENTACNREISQTLRNTLRLYDGKAVKTGTEKQQHNVTRLLTCSRQSALGLRRMLAPLGKSSEVHL